MRTTRSISFTNEELYKKIELFAKRNGVSRSHAVSVLCSAALENQYEIKVVYSYGDAETDYSEIISKQESVQP